MPSDFQLFGKHCLHYQSVQFVQKLWAAIYTTQQLNCALSPVVKTLCSNRELTNLIYAPVLTFMYMLR